MGFSINTNVTSLQAQEYLRVTSDFQGKTLNRVTSGLRIVASGDDAAGLAIANSLRSDAAVLTQGIRNANDGLSSLQTIDGGINNISKLLDRARTLASQSASDSFDGNRTFLNDEFQSVVLEIDRQAQAIGMNTGGKFAKSLSVFVGGGRDSTGSSTSNAAITNGSVTVDLSSSSVDSRSLGLATYKAGRSSGEMTLATAVAAGTVEFKFFGAGYESGVTISAGNLSTATSIDDVVASINTAIGLQAAAGGADKNAFKAADIVATKSSDGKNIEFSSATSSFTVSDATAGAAAARDILGTAGAGEDVVASGGHTVTLDFAAALAADDSQLLTVSMVDSSGALISTQIALGDADGYSKADVVTQINTALKATNNELATLVAVNPVADATATGNIQILGNNSSFKVYVGAGTGGNGLESGGAQGVFANSSAGSSGAVTISSAENAKVAVNALANAVSNLGAAQAVVGKGQNQLNYAVNLAQSQVSNIAAAESRIRDADLANEAANMTKAQILLQAGVAALAQANSAPQQILSLLRG